VFASLLARAMAHGQPSSSADPQDDIVDEAIRTFRANVLFRNFEVRNSADRVLIYLSLFIHQVLKRAEKVPTKAEALRQIMPLASGSHIMPGEPTWPLGTLLPAAKSSSELGTPHVCYCEARHDHHRVHCYHRSQRRSVASSSNYARPLWFASLSAFTTQTAALTNTGCFSRSENSWARSLCEDWAKMPQEQRGTGGAEYSC